MEEEIIEEEIIREIGISRYEAAMREDEKSRATIEKYLHHVRQFTAFCAGRKIDKEIMRKKSWGKAMLRPAQTPRWRRSTDIYGSAGWDDAASGTLKYRERSTARRKRN